MIMGLEISRNVMFKVCPCEDGHQGVSSLHLIIKLLLGLRMTTHRGYYKLWHIRS